MDRRITPANGRVAALHLQGLVEAESFVAGTPARVIRPVVDLLAAPGGARDRQLLFGDGVTVFEDRGGHAFVQATKDGYVGYLPSDALGAPEEPTHWLAAPGSHAYTAPDIKLPEVHGLVFGSLVRVVDERRRFMETSEGHFVPKKHLWPIGKRFADPVTAAQLFLGAPYLWGGNTPHGIDCSGLVQAAFLAAGIDCPGDSDMQESLGQPCAVGSALARGDLLFWKGHVALAVDGDTLIHANAHSMSVALEPAGAAIRRIEAQGDGPVTHHRRL